ncbi:hypothetical protein CK203_062426 [Vitis vinifera]|uniref:Uncharacterized protein n=1 Tax=Vitis vinifera TaxID=29760 RepID=A0A438FPY4_VITVI|nr:hypothetical protein CK203_062426 [Vitis vinifera]
MRRALQKQNRGVKPRNRAPDFKVRKFRTPKTKVRNPWPKKPFRTPLPQGAKSISRCEISAKGAIFAHQFQGAKFADQGAKISHEAQRTPHQLKPLESRTPISSFRPWRRPEEAFPPPHPHRHLDHSEPPWEPRFTPVQAPAIPPSEGEPFSAPIPHRRPPTDPVPPVDSHEPVSRPPAKRPSSRVLESHPTHLSQSQLQRNLGFQWTCLPSHYQASHDSRTTDEGNLDCRDRSFHSETYFDIEALRQQPELRDSFRLLQRVPLELVTLLRPSVYLMSRIQADFREWSSFSQSDMVRILSRGTSTASVLTRRELPSGMLLIDVLLRANLFPFSKVQRRGAILEALLGFLRAISSALII